MQPDRSVERNKRLLIKPLDSQTVHFMASLEDFSEGPEGREVIHSLVLEGTLSLPDLVILSVDARALKQPYRECAASVSPMRSGECHPWCLIQSIACGLAAEEH